MGISKEHAFEINGRQFRQTALKARPSLRGLGIVSTLLPSLATRGLQGLSSADLEELVDLFLPGAKVDWDPSGQGGLGAKFVPLETFFDLVFSLRTADLLEWLFECVSFQYSDFLAENGLARLVERVNALGSLTGSTGVSGD